MIEGPPRATATSGSLGKPRGCPIGRLRIGTGSGQLRIVSEDRSVRVGTAYCTGVGPYFEAAAMTAAYDAGAPSVMEEPLVATTHQSPPDWSRPCPLVSPLALSPT